MNEPRPIAVRPYRSGDEFALVELFQTAFGRRISVAHWNWKLKGQPSAVENVWLAASDERPVFQYAGIPMRLTLAGATATAMVSVDTMTAPDFRRRGLLTQVARQVYAAWGAGGIAFVIGLPNEQWGSRAAALGWQRLFPLQWLVRPLRPEAMLAHRLRMPILGRAGLAGTLWNRYLSDRVRPDPGVRTERVRQAHAGFDELWERCAGDATFSTVRDRKWVDWRFLASPSRRYEVTIAHRTGRPAGYSAHSLLTNGDRTTAHLAELFVAKGDDASRDTLLHELLRELLAGSAEYLITLAVPGTPNFRWLRKAGFLAGPAFSVQFVPLAAHLPLESMRDPANWCLSGADFDVI